MCHEQVQKVAQLALIFFLAALGVSAKADDDLNGRMERIGSDFGRGKISVAQLETQHQQLKDKFRSPTDLGKIEAHLAESLAFRTKRKDPELIIKHSERALQLPLDDMDRIRTNTILGDGLASKFQELKGIPWVKARRQIVAPYLRALKVVTQNLNGDSRQEVNSIDRYECGGGGPGCRKLEEQHAQQVESRQRAEKQNSLLDQKELLIEHCVNQYAYSKDRERGDPSELEDQARTILGRGAEPVVKEILVRLKEIRAVVDQHGLDFQKMRKGESSKKPVVTRRKEAIPIVP